MRSVAERNVFMRRIPVYLFKKQAQSGNKYTLETIEKCTEKKPPKNNSTKQECSIPFKSGALWLRLLLWDAPSTRQQSGKHSLLLTYRILRSFPLESKANSSTCNITLSLYKATPRWNFWELKIIRHFCQGWLYR